MKLLHDNTSAVKAVLSLLLASILFLPAVSSKAGIKGHMHCLAKPVFEIPAFEKQEKELKVRPDSGIEKPSFEKPVFEPTKMSSPNFDRLVVERPVFQKECIESVSERKVEEAKSFVPFPDDSNQRWGQIHAERRKLHITPLHQLKIRKVRIFR